VVSEQDAVRVLAVRTVRCGVGDDLLDLGCGEATAS
jgi:hypothetical protein